MTFSGKVKMDRRNKIRTTFSIYNQESEWLLTTGRLLNELVIEVITKLTLVWGITRNAVVT